MITSRKTANAISGKTARACDSCLRKRARWYCAADDAFLCQRCDSSVHSANQLASKHERVQLEKEAPNKAVFVSSPNNENSPAWLRGFTRKARTPRHPKPAKAMFGSATANTLPLVPEIGCEEEAMPDESEEQLLYRVPVFDPFAAELCNDSNIAAGAMAYEGGETATEGGFAAFKGVCKEACDGLDNHLGLVLPSDMDLAEFAADVESLLGAGLDEDLGGIEGLGLLDCKEDDDICKFREGRRVKIEDSDAEELVACQLDTGLDLQRETIDWNFDYELTGGEEEKVVAAMETSGFKAEAKRNMFLCLNYEGVISAWASQGSPWTDGIRPELNTDDGWPDFMGYSHPYGGVGGCCQVRGGDGGREARVSRYREKRRTRLFSKKIRYEVRKLNAEKRPRMKGRFVKRTPFAGAVLPYLMNN